MRSERDVFFEAIYRDWFDFLCRRCRRFVRYDPARMGLVEDCVQEAIFRAFLRYDRVSKHPHPVGWLTKTSENLLMNACKKRGVHSVPLPPDIAWDGLAAWHSEEDLRDLLRAMDELLTEKEAGVLREFFINERSTKEAAAVLSSSEASVASAVHRVKRKARKGLSQFFTRIGL